jgi:hypothetical protein
METLLQDRQTFPQRKAFLAGNKDPAVIATSTNINRYSLCVTDTTVEDVTMMNNDTLSPDQYSDSLPHPVNWD